jgi:hypothetical protein
MRKLAIVAFCSVLVAACGEWLEPDNYDDCILDGMKDAKTDAAIPVITRACERKFPVKTTKPLKGVISDSCIGNTSTIHDSFGDNLSFKDYLCLKQKGRLPPTPK